MATSMDYGSYFTNQNQNANAQMHSRDKRIHHSMSDNNEQGLFLDKLPSGQRNSQASIKNALSQNNKELKKISPTYKSMAFQPLPHRESPKAQNLYDYNISKKKMISNDVREILQSMNSKKSNDDMEKKQMYADIAQNVKDKSKRKMEFDEKLRLDKVKHQMEYKSILDYQTKEKPISNELTIGENSRLSKGVTKMEKANNCMIPGIYNLASTGSKPIIRSGLMIANLYK